MERNLWIILALAILVTVASCSSRVSQQQTETYINAKKLYFGGRLEEALETLRSEKFSSRRGHQGKLLEAKILFLQGHTTDAEPVLISLHKKNPGYSEAQLWLARAQLANDKTAAARETVENAMEYNPEDPRLLSLMGTICEKEKDYQQALEYLGRAALYGEDLARTEIGLAQLYYRFGQDKQANAHIQRAQALITEKSVLRRPLQELAQRMEKEKQNDE